MRARAPAIALSILSLLLFAAAGPSASTAAQVSEYELKAELLERFTRFIEWPPAPPDSPFLIAVVGQNPFGRYLDQIASVRRIKNRRVEVRYVDDLAQLENAHLVFIAANARPQLKSILSHTETKPVLTVGDSMGYAQSGVLINFYTQGDVIRFEINEAAVEKSGLRFSSKLFKLARLIEPEVRR